MKRYLPFLVWIPAIVFLTLAAAGAWRGMQTPRHEELSAFWEKDQWQEMNAYAYNLFRLGKADPETLMFGMLAARRLQDPDRMRQFGDAWLQTKVLNRKMELLVAESPGISGAAALLSLYRTRVTSLLLAILILLFLIPARSTRWISFGLCIAGSILLLM